MSTTGSHRDQLSPGQLAGRQLAGRSADRGGPSRRWPALRRAGDLLLEARTEADGARRFALARLSALTTALAVSAGTVQDLPRARAAGPWALFALVRPELASWAELFAASDRQWAAICRGGAGPDRAADLLLVQAGAFRAAVLSESVVAGPV